MAWVYILVENNTPDVMNVEITEDGILIWDEFYDYPKIETFAIIYDKNIPLYLRIVVKKASKISLDIPLENGPPAKDIRELVGTYVKEAEKAGLTFADKLINILKL